MKHIKSKTLIIFLLFVIVLTSVAAEILSNDVEVVPNSNLTYYLTVHYDGKDVYGNDSTTNITADIVSGYIHVEDKIPEGLTFDGFVGTEDGTIGAINETDGSPCSGHVVDGVNGLHYDENTRIVSYEIKDLQAGCKITVGIRTITPSVDDPNTPEVEDRRDFYNTATAIEGAYTVLSNTLHVWMGSDEVELYEVKYVYEGEVPANAPTIPSSKYVAGAKVGVEKDVSIEGYTFSGWELEDPNIAEITNGSFTMPAQTVILKGSFEARNKNKVTYSISTEYPDGYVLPAEKEYYSGSYVNVDTLAKGDIINGYRFTGWVSEDVTVSDNNDFLMPEQDVTFVGGFEEIKYSITYKFQGNIIPENADELLPPVEYYAPGTNVTLSDLVGVPPVTYKFLGWYTEYNFIMPENDIIVYGEWKIEKGYFEPTIAKEIIEPKEYYKIGDVVKYKITVTNTSNFPIRNIYVKENNPNASFIAGNGYEVQTKSFAVINEIPENSSINVYAEYVVTNSDSGTIVNEAQILGALADDNWLFNSEKEYKDTANFVTQPRLNLCNVVTGESDNRIFQYHITGNNYDSWVLLEENECSIIYLTPGTYNVMEVIPQDYKLDSVIGSITENNSSFTTELGDVDNVTFNNSYSRKGFYHSYGRIVNIIKYAINNIIPDVGEDFS